MGVKTNKIEQFKHLFWETPQNPQIFNFWEKPPPPQQNKQSAIPHPPRKLNDSPTTHNPTSTDLNRFFSFAFGLWVANPQPSAIFYPSLTCWSCTPKLYPKTKFLNRNPAKAQNLAFAGFCAKKQQLIPVNGWTRPKAQKGCFLHCGWGLFQPPFFFYFLFKIAG